MAIFQPVINGLCILCILIWIKNYFINIFSINLGVGGNLAAVHASRITTFLHKTSVLGVLPDGWHVTRFLDLKRAFLSNGNSFIFNFKNTKFLRLGFEIRSCFIVFGCARTYSI